MRVAYLPADRVELQFHCGESARAMAGRRKADLEALKRFIRFLLKYPRWIQSFERQEIVPSLVTGRAAKPRVLATFSTGDIC